MEVPNDAHTVEIVFACIGQALRNTTAGQVSRSDLLGNCMYSCLDGPDSFRTFHGQSGMANWSLAEINDSIGMASHACALVRCADGYVSFCQHAANMNAVVANAARYLRSRMCIDWQSESVIDELEQRVSLNLKGVVSYIFREAEALWQKVIDGMRALLSLVEELIKRIKEAAFVSLDDVDATDVDRWEEDYNQSLAHAVDCKREEFMKLVKRRMLANREVDDVVEQILDAHRSAAPNNPFIEYNPNHSLTAREMALYISENRSTLNCADVDEYLRYDAVFILAEEALAAFRTEDSQPRHRIIKGAAHVSGNRNVFVLPNVTEL